MCNRSKSVRKRTVARGLLRVASLAAVCLIVSAQPVSSYEVVWSTVACGGGTSTGQSYVLHGTIGQSQAGYSAGGQYVLAASFWAGKLQAPALLAVVMGEPLLALAGPHMLPWACLRTGVLRSQAQIRLTDKRVPLRVTGRTNRAR
jgi:hypothetical protein